MDVAVDGVDVVVAILAIRLADISIRTAVVCVRMRARFRIQRRHMSLALRDVVACQTGLLDETYG